MAWTTVEILDKRELIDGVQRVNVRFSTNEPTPRVFEAPIDIAPGADADFFDRSARRILARLADRDGVKAQADAVTLGTYVPGPEPPPPTPDPDQALKEQVLAQLNLRRQLQKAVDLGLVSANHSPHITQLPNL